MVWTIPWCFARFRTTFISDGASPAVSVLDAAQTWAPPPDVIPRELKSKRAPNILKAILQNYRAPKK
jgi:hypothetical protein